MPLRALAMKPTRLLILVLAGLIAVLTGCDAKPSTVTPTADGNVRQVTVVGSGEVDGTPDTVTVDAAIESLAPDATAALNATNERMTQVIEAVAGQGIDRKDISTTQVSLQPQYGDNSVITAYRATNAIAIKIRNIDTASAVIGTIQTTGGNATRINSVNFSIDDDSQLVKDARARAFNDAKSRAEQYSELSGLTLGKVISITEAGATLPPPVPVPRFDATEAAAASPLQPGQQTVGFSVTVVWELG